jgi:hypothetical protein
MQKIDFCNMKGALLQKAVKFSRKLHFNLIEKLL